MARYEFTSRRGGLLADTAGDGSLRVWARFERAPELETAGEPRFRVVVDNAAAAKRLRAMVRDDPDGYGLQEVKTSREHDNDDG